MAPYTHALAMMSSGFLWTLMTSQYRFMLPITHILKKPIKFKAVIYQSEEGPIQQNMHHTLYAKILDSPKALLNAGMHVRLTYRIPYQKNANDIPLPGSVIHCYGMLMPFSSPVFPGAYDFSRQAHFDNLQGRGYLLSQPRILRTDASYKEGFLKRWRRYFWHALKQKLSPEHAGIVAALILGQKNTLTSETKKTFTASGLSHLLVVSGLHITHMTQLFISVLTMICIISAPRFYERYHLHRLFLGLGVLASGMYVMFTGSALPSQRAFLMTFLGTLGILIQRPLPGLRSLAWAALLALILNPSCIYHPSFQLSFGAVLALMTWRWPWKRPKSGSLKVIQKILENLFCSIKITLLTAPLCMDTFQCFYPGGIITNMVAIPWTTYILMPASFLGGILWVVGCDGAWLWYIWAKLIEILLIIAQWGKGILGVISTTFLGTWVVPCWVFGWLWSSLWQTPWRHFGWFFMSMSFLGMLWPPKPKILMHKNHKTAGIFEKNHAWIMGYQDYYARRDWHRFWPDKFFPWTKKIYVLNDQWRLMYCKKKKHLQLFHLEQEVMLPTGSLWISHLNQSIILKGHTLRKFPWNPSIEI
jgi:competence protein ComEC